MEVGVSVRGCGGCMAFPRVLTMIEVPTRDCSSKSLLIGSLSQFILLTKMAAAVNLQIRVFGQEPLSPGDPVTFERWSGGSDGDLCTRLVSRSPLRRHIRLY